MINRREFIDARSQWEPQVWLSGPTAKSYGQILGANKPPQLCRDRTQQPRVRAPIGAPGQQAECLRSAYVCDVDSNIQWPNSPLTTNRGDGHPLQRLKRISARFWSRRMSTPSASPAPDHWHTPIAIAGSASGQARLCGEALQPQSRPKERCWSRRKRNTARRCRWAPSSARRHTASRSLGKIHERPDWPRLLCQSLVLEHQEVDWLRQAGARATRSSIGICGRAPRPVGPTPTTFSHITGTGSGPMAPAKRLTMEPMKWTSAAGRSTSNIPSGLRPAGGRYQFKDDWQFYDTLVTSFDYQLTR